MIKKEIIVSQIKKAVQAVDRDASIVLFGSQARGTSHEESDWDILILTNKANIDILYKRYLLRQIMEVELEYGITVSSVIRRRKDWEDLSLTWFYQEVQKDGKKIA